jgi:hypothetical protein
MCAPGIDMVTKKGITTLIDLIGTKIVKITNNILASGIYPEELKVAKIIPLYKKGAHDSANNYRPISLLSVFSKILEKIIKNRLIEFIDTL